MLVYSNEELRTERQYFLLKKLNTAPSFYFAPFKTMRTQRSTFFAVALKLFGLSSQHYFRR